MKTVDKFFCLKPNSQHGGMLMEMMLSVALAAITIPFVARYQKNTIERARNVAVVKQMDIVRGALERCIMENRSNYLNHTGQYVFSENDISDPTRIDCLVLSDGEDEPHGLINYGLTPEFINDYGNDYTLRIRKSEDNTGQAVLQGIVLLRNGNVNTLSTREIVNLGGGQVGFTDGNYVRGGFNAFSTEKTNYGLTTSDQGIIQTTETARGDSKYLWRTADSSKEDRTMLSFLNLDMHDIINIAGFKANEAHFSNSVSLNPDLQDTTNPYENPNLVSELSDWNPDIDSNIKTLKFSNNTNLNRVNLRGTNAYVNGNFSATSDSTLTAQQTMTINSDSSVSEFNAVCGTPYLNEGDVQYCNQLTFDRLNIPLCPKDLTDAVCMDAANISLDFDKTQINDLKLYQLINYTKDVYYNDFAVTSHLRLGLSGTGEQLMAAKPDAQDYFINGKDAKFKSIILTGTLKAKNGDDISGLKNLVRYVADSEPGLYSINNSGNTANSKYGKAWEKFCPECYTDNGAFGVFHALQRIQDMQQILILKNKCTDISTWCANNTSCSQECWQQACAQIHVYRIQTCLSNYSLHDCAQYASCLYMCGDVWPDDECNPATNETNAAIKKCVCNCDSEYGITFSGTHNCSGLGG